MKKCTIIALAALLVSAQLPAFAATDPNQEKAICNLAAQNCVSKVQALKERVDKLNRELTNPKKKYSAAEMQKLEKKLDEAQRQLDKVESTAK